MRYRTKVDIPGLRRIVKAGEPLTLSGSHYMTMDTMKHGGEFWLKEFVESTPEFFEPIQEPIWTDEDMIEFARFGVNDYEGGWATSLIKFKEKRGIKD